MVPQILQTGNSNIFFFLIDHPVLNPCLNPSSRSSVCLAKPRLHPSNPLLTANSLVPVRCLSVVLVRSAIAKLVRSNLSKIGTTNFRTNRNLLCRKKIMPKAVSYRRVTWVCLRCSICGKRAAWYFEQKFFCKTCKKQ